MGKHLQEPADPTKAGKVATVQPDGTVDWDVIPETYTLPTAAADTLGGVKIGSGVSITDGAISVSTNYAAPLGADDNYVTDAEKGALHGHSNKTALDLIDTLGGKVLLESLILKGSENTRYYTIYIDASGNIGTDLYPVDGMLMVDDSGNNWIDDSSNAWIA